MEIIHIHHPFNRNREDFPPLVMALGFFDGVHLGHKEVIMTAVQKAEEKGIKSAVMTFDPHPSVVLRRDITHVEYITPLEEKARLIAELSVDYLFVVHFSTDFANLLPQEFVDQYIIATHVVHVVAGFDYTYGKMGKGTMETLPFHSRNAFDSTVVPKLTFNKEKISSTLIREYIKNGNIEAVQEYLGRYYTTSGIVIHGDKRGRTIGFPTANTDISNFSYTPPVGVYTVRILVRSKWYEGICNIGYKPTFKDKEDTLSVEVHIFHFDEEIYGEKIVIEWRNRIRSEQKFSSVDGLVKQIQYDKEQAMDYFQSMKVSECDKDTVERRKG